MTTRVHLLSYLFGSCGRPRSCNRFRGSDFRHGWVADVELLAERVAALELGKAVLAACVRVPHPQAAAT
jgi:hypothetical protein